MCIIEVIEVLLGITVAVGLFGWVFDEIARM